MKVLKVAVMAMLLCFVASAVSAQYKMDGKTLRNSSGSSVGYIDSDGKTIRNSSGSSVGYVDSDGKTVRNSSGSSVIKLDSDGKTIRNSSGSSFATMSDVKSAINGAKDETVYVALWWFLIKNK